MSRRELTADERWLLQKMVAGDGTVGWAEATAMTGLDARDFKRFVRGLLDVGFVESRDQSSPTPTLRITEDGLAEIERDCGLRAARRFVVRVRTADVANDALEAQLSEDGTVLARLGVRLGSHQLASLRYLLLYQPKGLSHEVVSRAACDIGSSLLPECAACRAARGRRSRACTGCPRGIVLQALGELPAGGWIRLGLDLEPPWTFVPWELAAITSSSYLAADRRVSIVRHVGGRSSDAATLRDVRLLVAIPACGDTDAGTFRREAEEIVELVHAPPAEARADVLDGFRGAEELAAAVERHAPTAVQLIAHGSPKGLMVGDGTVRAGELASALRRGPVELAVLGSCFGATSFGTDRTGGSLAAQVVASGTRSAVAFEGLAEADHARRFALTFYRNLLDGCSIERAVLLGRQEILNSPLFMWGQIVLVA